MRLQRCKNGHFYDADKYRVCPHCVSGDRLDEEKTEVVYESGAYDGEQEAARRERARQRHGENPGMRHGENFGTRPMRSALGMTLEQGVSLKREDREKRADAEPLQGAPAQANSPFRFAPVVGWLVCTRGAHLGESFVLYEGMNTIGRTPDADIQLRYEGSIAASDTASVAFDPGSGRFYAFPGSANALCFVNGEAVLSRRPLQKNDRVGVGEALLMLIPCCDAAFDWRYGGDA